jgi:ketosteroid isomerase-like protein
MSRENVELVRRLADAFEVRSLDAIRPFLDPGLVWHEDPSFPEAGVYRGRDAWEAYARQFLAEFSEIRYEPGEAIDAGDDVVVNMRIRGRGSASGAEFDLSAWWAFTVRDGKVVQCFSYLDRDRALEAVGLRE